MDTGRPSAELIADVVADIRAGRAVHPAAVDDPGIVVSLKALEKARRPQPVVDCTAIFHMQRTAEKIDLYDDHPSITPPWEDALLCYVNSFGNVMCLQVHRHDWATGTRPKDWYSDNEADWTRVRWIAETAIWVGGTSGDGEPIPTSGPCHIFRHAIRDDGGPEDINWMALLARPGQYGRRGEIDDPNQGMWDVALIILGAALNFLNATNVDIAEPARPRPTRRRIARTGVAVQTIVVRPPGRRRTRTAPTDARPLDTTESVLSPVRGHFSHYGPKYNAGLLFGKYAGKFWIPGHVRGALAGEEAPDQKTYVLKP